MASAANAERPKVLVVEDEFIIALDVSETVMDLGYALDGPYESKDGALRAIEDQLPDCAILDVFTSDGEVYPLADALTEAGVPIIFHSGHVSPSDVSAFSTSVAPNSPSTYARTTGSSAKPPTTVAVWLMPSSTASGS